MADFLRYLKPRLYASESEFLPAAVEVLETPASPLKHTLTTGICLLFVLTFVWAWLGKKDVVVVAEGRVIPLGQTRTISAAHMGRVRHLYVQEGSRVKSGDRLVELETYPSDLESLPVQPALDIISAQLSLLRLDTLLDRVTAQQGFNDNSEPVDLRQVADSQKVYFDNEPSSLQWETESSALNSELNQFMATDQAMAQKIEERRAVLAASQEELARLQQLQSIHTRLAESAEKLYRQQMSSELEWLVRREKQIDTVQQLAVMQRRCLEHQASLEAAYAEKLAWRQEFYTRQNREKLQLVRQLEQTRVQLEKARHRHSSQILTAPLDGVVQQLQLRSRGDVVEPAHSVMVIVPDPVRLEVEALVENKDIRWITPGLPVGVKIEAFPYNRFGQLQGTVRSVARDAIHDEQKGWLFSIYIELAQEYFEIAGQDTPIQPGMSLVADVIVGQRRLLEYFLSPLLRYRQESFRETM